MDWVSSLDFAAIGPEHAPDLARRAASNAPASPSSGTTIAMLIGAGRGKHSPSSEDVSVRRSPQRARAIESTSSTSPFPRYLAHGSGVWIFLRCFDAGEEYAYRNHLYAQDAESGGGQVEVALNSRTVYPQTSWRPLQDRLGIRSPRAVQEVDD